MERKGRRNGRKRNGSRLGVREKYVGERKRLGARSELARSPGASRFLCRLSFSSSFQETLAILVSISPYAICRPARRLLHARSARVQTEETWTPRFPIRRAVDVWLPCSIRICSRGQKFCAAKLELFAPLKCTG